METLASAGGLSSGIDLALRVVERYFGREVAEKTAYNMEYQGLGWMNPNSNQVYAAMPRFHGRTPALCSMWNGCRSCHSAKVRF